VTGRSRFGATIERIVLEPWPGLDRSRIVPAGIRLGEVERVEREIATLDTEDGSLQRAGVFVRCEGDEWVVECGRYGTWRTPGPCGTVTAPLAFVLDGVRRGGTLTLRPRVRVREKCWPMLGTDTAGGRLPVPVGRWLEETRRVIDGKRVVAQRRYIAVEGSAELIERVRRRLAERGLNRREIGDVPMAQALGGSDPELWELEKDLSAEVVLRRSLSRAVDRLLAHDPVTRADLHGEGVHQMRVAVRSIRSTLRTFAPLLGPVDEGLGRDLRWLGDLLGEVRDLDVLIESLRTSAEELPEADRALLPEVIAEATGQRAEHLAALLEAMASPRYAALVGRLGALDRSVEFSRAARKPAEPTLRRFARRAYRKLRRSVETVGRKDAVVEDVHIVRLLAKKFRYSLDAIAEVSADAMAQARALARFQDTLGEFHDAYVAQEWLRSLTEVEEDPGAMFVIGQLVAVQRARMERSRRDWPGAWRRTSRRRTRAWLEH
jgi:CHAD domain-containing protein